MRLKLSKKIKQGILIVITFGLFMLNVNALTSDGVTYDNKGNTEILTDTLDELLKAADVYKTGGSVTANQMLKGATGYAKGELVTGNIESKGAETYKPGTSNQTIGAGVYLSGAQTIEGDANLTGANIAAGKSIFGVAGTFTSDANATAGNILSGKTAYVNGAKVTGTIPSKGAATYTPGTSNQTISSGQYLSGAQTIAGSANLVAANIKSGVTIFGATGTFTSDANATAAQILSGKTAYVNGAKVTGTIPSKGAATYTPGTSNQTISSGQYLSGAQTIAGDPDLVAANIISGKNIFGVNGSHTALNHEYLIHVGETWMSNGKCNFNYTKTADRTGKVIVWMSVYSSAGTLNSYLMPPITIDDLYNGSTYVYPIYESARDNNYTRGFLYFTDILEGQTLTIAASYGEDRNSPSHNCDFLVEFVL